MLEALNSPPAAHMRSFGLPITHNSLFVINLPLFCAATIAASVHHTSFLLIAHLTAQTGSLLETRPRGSKALHKPMIVSKYCSNPELQSLFHSCQIYDIDCRLSNI